MLLRFSKPLAVLVVLAMAGFAFWLPTTKPRATPPDVISVEDSLFGYGDGKFFVLRTVQDNLGSHFAHRIETWLVAIDAESGEERFWPVHAATLKTEFGGEGESNRQIVETDRREDAVDPFAVLADHDAMPLFERRPSATDPQTPVRRTGDIVEIGRTASQMFRLRRAGSVAAYEQSIASMAERVANIGRMGSIDTRAMFGHRSIDTATCSHEPIGWPRNFAPDGPGYQPVRVTCHDGYEMERDSLIQIARQRREGTSR